MLHEPVAQRTEQEFPKLKVAGSIPAGLPSEMEILEWYVLLCVKK